MIYQNNMELLIFFLAIRHKLRIQHKKTLSYLEVKILFH